MKFKKSERKRKSRRESEKSNTHLIFKPPIDSLEFPLVLLGEFLNLNVAPAEPLVEFLLTVVQHRVRIILGVCVTPVETCEFLRLKGLKVFHFL